jgi:hypothetical protein
LTWGTVAFSGSLSAKRRCPTLRTFRARITMLRQLSRHHRHWAVISIARARSPAGTSFVALLHARVARAYISRAGKSWPAARSGSRPLFGEDVVNLVHDPFCPLNRSRDHGGGSRTLPGVEEIIGGSQVTSHEDTRHNRQDSFSAFIHKGDTVSYSPFVRLVVGLLLVLTPCVSD